jgi:hypothetical protein
MRETISREAIDSADERRVLIEPRETYQPNRNRCDKLRSRYSVRCSPLNPSIELAFEKGRFFS